MSEWIPAGWSRVMLGDFIKLQRGYDLPKDTRRNGTVPVIGSGGPAGNHDVAVVRGPGITIGRAANLGVPTLTEEDFWPLNTTLFITDFNKNDIRFTYYLLKTIDLAGYNSGSVQPMLNRNYIHNYPLTVPPPIEQRTIAGLLGALDGKIASNNRATATIKQLLDAHFGGLMNGAHRTVQLGAVLDFRYGKALKEENRTVGSVPIFGGNGISGWHNTPLVNGPGVIVGRKGANAGSVSWSQGDFWPIDTSFFVQARTGLPMEFVYFLLEAVNLRRLVGDSAIPGLSRDIALRCEVSLPTANAIQNFASLARTMLDLVDRKTSENRALTELRDTLLLKLISGELRIRDAERHVGDVV